MGPFGGRSFPGTNLQDLNLDWIIQRVKALSTGIIAPYINTTNYHWMVYDTEAETFVDSGVSAAGEGTGPQGEPGKSPIIGSNGNWYVWDTDTEAFVDTGISAQGPAGPIGPTGPQGERGPGVNRNILDNWYFVGGGSQLGDGVFPINQRGQTTYSGSVYGVDRWRGYNSTISVSVLTDGMQISFENTAENFGQDVKLYSGTTYTLSVLTNNGLVYGSGTPNASSNTEIFRSGNFIFRFNRNNGILITSTAASSTIKIIAIKLELGDTQTLAHQENGGWVLNELPDYAEELAKCQRYFQRIKNSAGSLQFVGNGWFIVDTQKIIVPVQLLQPMVGTPTVTISSVSDFEYSYKGVGPVDGDITAITRNASGFGFCSVYLNVNISTARTAGDVAALLAKQNAYIDFSAE